MNSSEPGARDVEDESAISTLSKVCLKEYENLCSSLRNTNSEDAKQIGYDRSLVLRAVEDAKARFKAWATNIAAFQKGTLRSSLDFRLKEAGEIRRRILKVLDNLKESLIDSSSIVSGSEPNETWEVGAISDSEDEAPVKPSEIERTSDLDELIKAIKAANISLMKMSMVIRNSPSRDDYLKAATRYSFDPRYDIGHVMEKHGSAKRSSDWLLERLGKAITRRRQYLKYREDHHGKLTRDWEEAPAAPEVKLDLQEEKPPTTIAHTKATTFVENIVLPEIPDGEELGGSFGGSQTSYEATMVGEGGEIRPTVPQHPKMAFDGIPFEFGAPFQCPYCYTEQTVKNRAAWKKHVFRDLKPYVCTFRQCDLRMFRSRSEWFAHEVQIHRREWTCPRCELGPFDNTESFQNHLIKIHSSPSGSQLEALVLQSEEPVDKISPTACKLCDDWETNLLDSKHDSRRLFLNDGHTVEPYGTLNQFRRHLGRHMEQLALFALPKSDGDEMEDDSADSDDDGEENIDQAIEHFQSHSDKSDHRDQGSNGDSPSISMESSGSTLWVLDIPETTTIASLRAEFEPYGVAVAANVFHRATCGLLSFEDTKEALSVKNRLDMAKARPRFPLSFAKPASLTIMQSEYLNDTSCIWDDMELGIGIDESSLEGHISSFLLETFGKVIPTRKLLDAVTQYGLPRILTPDEKNEIRVRAFRNRKVITQDPEAFPDDLISDEKTSSTKPRIVQLTQDLKHDLRILESRKIKIPPGFISSLEKQYFQTFNDPEASGYIDPVAKRTFLEVCGGLERQELHKMGESGYFEGLILEFFQYTIARRFGASQKRKVSQLVATFVRMIKLVLIIDHRGKFGQVIGDMNVLEHKLNTRYLVPTGYQNPDVSEESDQEPDSVSQPPDEYSEPANQDNMPSLLEIENSGTELFVAANHALEILTQWSQNRTTEKQVSDAYGRLFHETYMAGVVFKTFDIDIVDIDNFRNSLQAILEYILGRDAGVESLGKYLPQIKSIILDLLNSVKQKQRIVRQKQAKDDTLQPEEQMSSTFLVPSEIPVPDGDEGQKIKETEQTERKSIYRCDICGNSFAPGSVWACRECDIAYCEDCWMIESSRSEEATLTQSHRHVLYRPELRTFPDLPGRFPSLPPPFSENPSSAQSIETPPTNSRNVGSTRPKTPSWADFLSSGFVEGSENTDKRRGQEKSRKTSSSTVDKASSRVEIADEEDLHPPTHDDSEDRDEDFSILGDEPSQQRRMTAFQFEPVSLPASRVPSDEGSSDGEEVDFDAGRDSPVPFSIDPDDAKAKIAPKQESRDDSGKATLQRLLEERAAA